MFSTALKSFGIATSLGGIAWGSVQIYSGYCAPPGLTGFMQSLITMDSSPCKMVAGLMTHSQTLYASMTVAFLHSIFSVIKECLTQTG